eukprot:EG_transcript_19078
MSRRTLDAGLVDGGTGDWSGMLVLRLVHLPLPLAQTISGQLDHWLMSPPGRFNHLLLVSPRQHKRQAGFVAMCINVIVLEIPARVLSEPFFFGRGALSNATLCTGGDSGVTSSRECAKGNILWRP